VRARAPCERLRGHRPATHPPIIRACVPASRFPHKAGARATGPSGRAHLSSERAGGRAEQPGRAGNGVIRVLAWGDGALTRRCVVPSPAAAPALRPGSRAATLGLRRPAAWCAPVPHRTRLLCKEEGKPEEGEAAEAAPAEEAAAEAEVVEPEEPVDPFAGLDLDSKEFLQRKVEVLEKELEEATARVAELEGDAAAADPLIARGIVSSTKVCSRHSLSMLGPMPRPRPASLRPRAACAPGVLAAGVPSSEHPGFCPPSVPLHTHLPLVSVCVRVCVRATDARTCGHVLQAGSRL